LNDFLSFEGTKSFDITAPSMICVQKLTSLAFAYYDGIKPVEMLTPDQKSQAIKKLPHFLEFTSYIFNFQGMLCGPLCFYEDYIEFIHGTNITKFKDEHKNRDPSYDFGRRRALIKKVFWAIIFAIIFFKLSKYRFVETIKEEHLELPFLHRLLFLYLTAFNHRVKYYVAFLISEAVCVASGFGFNGYDAETGEPKWDLIKNIDIYKLETVKNMKCFVDNWNIQTGIWLRRIAYDRLPKGKTLGVFVLSAFWHGFYPGYYLTFILAAFLIYAGRGVRLNCSFISFLKFFFNSFKI
jgi:lysophospholipid acyltransferase 1/2